MNVRAIINPIAGGGYSSKIYPSVISQFRKFGIEFDLTERTGHAVTLARRAVSDGVDYLLCIGGDGTLNEVVQALIHTDTVLAPISAGTGSDFVKTLGLSSVEQIIRSIENRRFLDMDLGVAEASNQTRYFLNILEVGLGAKVIERVNSRKKVRGSASFTSSLLASLPSFRPYEMKISSREIQQEGKVAEIVVGNGRYFGGGMLAAPGAKLDDGLLDVHIVRGMNIISMLKRLRKLRDGTYVNDPSVTSFKTEKIDIDGNAPVEMDGEDFGTLPIKLRVEKKCMKVLAP